MRTFIIFVVAFLIGLTVQATLIHTIIPSAIAPDFITALILYLALRYRNAGGAVGAFLLGIGCDLASARFLGPNGAGGVMAFVVATSLSSHIYAERSTSLALLAFLCSVVKSSVALLMLYLYTQIEIFNRGVLTVVLEEALLTAVVAPLVIRLLQRGQSPILFTSPLPLGREARKSI